MHSDCSSFIAYLNMKLLLQHINMLVLSMKKNLEIILIRTVP